MRVNLYATFRLIAGIKSFDINLPQGSTIFFAAQQIAACHPMLKKHWFNESGELHAHVHVFLNGEEVFTLPNQLQTPVAESDELSFFPPVAGG